MMVDRALVEAALPSYVLGAELGRGACGLVIAAWHRRLGRQVAVKVLARAGDAPDQLEERFLAEAQVLSELDHPHIVRLHDYVEHSGLCLLVMERLSGGSVGARTLAKARPEYACGLGLAVADALHAAHQRRVLHRDVKPDNLLFAADGTVKVTDFGIAKLFDGTAAASSSFVGSPIYMAPEQASLGRLGPATDLYSLSVVLYQLLTGRPLFPPDLPPAAMLLQHLNQRPAPIPDVPAGVASVVLRGLAKDMADRQPTARAFAFELATAAARAYGSGWLTRAQLPLRIDDELRDAARSLPPMQGGAVAPFETTVGRPVPWPLSPARAAPPADADRPADADPGGGSDPGDLPVNGPDRVALASDGVVRPEPTRGGQASTDEPTREHGIPGSAERRIPGGPRRGGRAEAELPRSGRARAALPADPSASAGGRLSTGRTSTGPVVVTAAPAWLLPPVDERRRRWPRWPRRSPRDDAEKRPRGRVLAGGFAVLVAGAVAIVIGLGVSTLMVNSGVAPGPGGLAAFGDAVYVSDSAHNQVRRLSAKAVVSSARTTGVVVAGDGADGFAGDGGAAVDARLSRPASLAVDATGNLYIADLGNRRVRMVSTDGRISTVAGGGGDRMDGGRQAERVALSVPFSIAASGRGTLWIAEERRNRVSRLGADGTIQVFAGTGQAGFAGDGFYASKAMLNDPTAIAVDRSGQILYIADQGNRRVRSVRVGSGIIRTFAGDGGDGPLRNNLQATSVSLDGTYALATMPDGTVYIGGRDLRKVTPAGFIAPVATPTTASVAVAGNGALFLVSVEKNGNGDGVRQLYLLSTNGHFSRLDW